MLEVRAVISATAPCDDAWPIDDAIPPRPAQVRRRCDRLGRVACGAATAALLAASAAFAVCRPDGHQPVPISSTGPLAAEAGSSAP